jgi:hypothetical protein
VWSKSYIIQKIFRFFLKLKLSCLISKSSYYYKSFDYIEGRIFVSWDQYNILWVNNWLIVDINKRIGFISCTYRSCYIVAYVFDMFLIIKLLVWLLNGSMESWPKNIASILCHSNSKVLLWWNLTILIWPRKNVLLLFFVM